jgi:hypothetical protein
MVLVKNNRILVGIPTRERPEYLSGLLATLMYQDEPRWDLLIVDTSPDEDNRVKDHPQVSRFVQTLEALGHLVEFIERPNKASTSSVIAVNTILTEAVLREYSFLFFVDDDHTVPPNTLRRMREFIENCSDFPALISGVTPWMQEAWYGAATPEDVFTPDKKVKIPPSDIRVQDGELRIGKELFYRWDTTEMTSLIVESPLASDANFMMRPDLRILQSDIGPSSLHAFSVWFLQMRHLLGYRLFFDVSINVWHVAAPHGGVRVEVGNHVKDLEEDLRRRAILEKLVKDFGISSED